DDIGDMKGELDGIWEKMDNVEKSLSAREANFGGAIEFRDSISQDLMLDQIKLAETFEGPWNAAVDQLSSASNFFGIAERKRKVADDMKSAREKSFRAYLGLNSIFSETSSSVINGSQYLKAVKRRDFRAQMGEEWSGLDLSTLEQESETEAAPTTSAESAGEGESARDDVIVIQEAEESTEPATDSESRDVTRDAEASTSSTTAATSSAPASINSAPENKHLITGESTDIAREKAVSYRSFFSLKKKSPSTEGGTDDKDTKTETTPLTGSFFLFRKKSLTEDSGIGEKKEVEGTFASWRKYFASVTGTGTGDANGKEDTSSKKTASSSKKKAHTLEGHPVVKEIEKSALASSAAPVEEAKVSVVSDNNKENAHVLVEAKAEGVSLQQISGKKAV
ncbi:hypothetical protein, partial [Anaplasma bovis]|uniref:hypothetical protein n=1 Tax=Anaplasma bovis TaxID=186733 RepID=UPI002FF19A41